jgi:predicted HD superfamily hydrolase involved in NAD metabolism
MVEKRFEQLKRMLSEKRYHHSIRVMDTCEELAVLYYADIEKCKLAGLLHDCAREIPKDDLLEIASKKGLKLGSVELCVPDLIHSHISAVLARDLFGVDDLEVLSAIRCHTTGKEEMTLVDKILFVSDFIEPERKFSGVDEIRKMAYNDIDDALYMVLKSIIMYVVEKDNRLHPDTLNAFNWSLGRVKTNFY